MKQKKESTIKNSASRAQDGEGIQDILEPDLEQVTGGLGVSKAEIDFMSVQSPAETRKRGTVVGVGEGSKPWLLFADGEKINV